MYTATKTDAGLDSRNSATNFHKAGDVFSDVQIPIAGFTTLRVTGQESVVMAESRLSTMIHGNVAREAERHLQA